MVEPDRPQMTIRRMRIACGLPRATDKHSEYLILIAFPLQQWLYECASLLFVRSLPVLLRFKLVVVWVAWQGGTVAATVLLFLVQTAWQEWAGVA